MKRTPNAKHSAKGGQTSPARERLKLALNADDCQALEVWLRKAKVPTKAQGVLLIVRQFLSRNGYLRKRREQGDGEGSRL